MIDKQIQPIFQLCSYLLSYPDESFHSTLGEIEYELNQINHPALTKELYQFCEKAKKQSLHSLVSTYIATFDFGKKTNLYVSYMANGEQRERGMDLLFLKNYYKMHGFHVTDRELPDFLPILLEFASQVTVEKLQPVFKRSGSSIAEIAAPIDPKENVYGHVFQAILSALGLMEMIEIENEVKIDA